jgi:tetratricopeptide (TPR) repeat protein
MRRDAFVRPVLCVVLSAGLSALYAMLEVRQVPIDRLLANLEAARKADPQNVQHEINIARLYGMAYALRSNQVPAIKGLQDKEEPWYGHAPNLVPYTSKPLSDEERQSQAGTALARAIDHYEAALRLKPDDPLAHLGYGWMLQQRGDTMRAIAEYRRVIADAWPAEQNAIRASFRPFFTVEAAGYLIPLLDPAADRAEIETLRARQSQLQALPRPITPIAIPLDDRLDAGGLVDRAARVRFDADGSGRRSEWTWITSRSGWLVYDATGSGRISSALQWFGTVTFWLFWQNGYEALAALDDDASGELTGRELRGLAIWLDANQNGVSEPGEVRPIDAYGIVGLSCRSTPGDGVTIAAMSADGVRFGDGRRRASYDVILHPSPSLRRLTLE